MHQLDGREFTKTVLPDVKNGFAFFDPPYIIRGGELYLNSYSIEDHRELAFSISTMSSPWIVTYDEAALTERLYEKHRWATFGLNYVAQSKRLGTEVMFASDSLSFPEPTVLFGDKIKVLSTTLQKPAST